MTSLKTFHVASVGTNTLYGMLISTDENDDLKVADIRGMDIVVEYQMLNIDTDELTKNISYLQNVLRAKSVTMIKKVQCPNNGWSDKGVT